VARGNVYVPGNLTYKDAVDNGVRDFGKAADGTENNLGIAAGGNILVGDYLTPKGGSLTSTASLMTGNSADGFGFVLSEISIFNRREWQKTQATLPGPGGIPVINSTFIPGYKPKYYKLTPSSPVWVFTITSKVTWNDATQTWIGSEHAGKFLDLTAITPPASAVISYLNPAGFWITGTQLKEFWIEDENNRAAGSAFAVDALLYTDSAVFTLARSASKTAGQLTINGALVARDTGILAGGHLEINYDQRVKQLLQVRDTSKVLLSQTVLIRKHLE
jgi:hypothetical protein